MNLDPVASIVVYAIQWHFLIFLRYWFPVIRLLVLGNFCPHPPLPSHGQASAKTFGALGVAVYGTSVHNHFMYAYLTVC